MKQQLPELGIRFGFWPALMLCVVLVVSTTVPALIQIGGWTTDTSFIDNRPPTAFPSVPRSLQDLSQFRDGLAKFIDDRFGLRAELLKLNVRLNQLIGVSKNPNMVVGKKGWMFLKEGNDGFEQFRGLNRFSDAELDAWIDIMEKYQRWTALYGSKFMVVIAPNQQTIYPEFMPGYITRVVPETRLDQLVRRLRERNSPLVLIDPRVDLWAKRNELPVYHRYENHWNWLGAFVAYAAMMREVDKMFPGTHGLTFDDITISMGSEGWQIPPISEPAPVIKIKSQSVTGVKVVATIGGTNIEKVTTRLSQAPSVLMYGDSFGYPGLSTFMRQSFSWTMFVPTGNVQFPFDLIERHRPSLVVFELVERFLAYPREDRDLLLKEAPAFETVVRDKEASLGGYVEGVSDLNDGTVMFPGWATDVYAKTKPLAIFAYQGDRVVGAVVPTLRRPELGAGLQSDLIAFRLVLPRAVAIGVEPLRFFSTNPSGRIYEIVFSADAAAQLAVLKQGITK